MLNLPTQVKEVPDYKYVLGRKKTDQRKQDQ